jgi:hypothetical protein
VAAWRYNICVESCGAGRRGTSECTSDFVPELRKYLAAVILLFKYLHFLQYLFYIMLDFRFCVLHFVDERGMMNIQINTHFASQPSAQNQAIKFNSINITAI